MEFIIPTSALSKALYLAHSIVEKRTTMPILSNVLISSSKGRLEISATDLEITTKVSVPADVKIAGSTTVNAKMLADIVRELPDTKVEVKLLDGERLEIKADNTSMKLIGVSAEEYPSLPGLDFNTKNKISTKLFSEMIGKTLYSVSTDETRFNLNGVCFDSVDEGLRLVATDGHRLAMITRPANALSISEKAIVPRKGLSELRKILDNSESEEIGVDIIEGFLIVEAGETKISMRLIDGEFPDYNQVFPKQEGVKAIAASEPLVQALKRAALMVTDKGKCVKMDFSKDKLRVSSSSQELGESTEEMKINYSGDPLSVGFNARYIIDFANSINEKGNVVIELNGELGPGKFYVEGDQSYVGIVMPMRLT